MREVLYWNLLPGREKYFLGLSAMLTKILVWTKYVLKGASDVQLRCRSFPLL
jgi:hypothetical protein